MEIYTQTQGAAMEAAQGQHVVAVRLAQRTYAVPLQSVIQIIPMVAITPLPQAHPAVEGVINFRGDAVLILNMRRYLHLPEAAPGLYTPIMLLHIGQRMVGLIVDEVLDVTTIQPERVARLTDLLPEGLGRVPVLQGLTHTDAGALLLLDLEQLFAPGQAHALQTALTALDDAALSSAALEAYLPAPELEPAGSPR